MIKARSAAAVRHRRRGSVLILVMTLLGILFVTGVAFLASMSFEAEIVSIERRRDRRAVGIEAVLTETVSAYRDGFVGDGDAPFGGALDEPLASTKLGVAPAMLGELPGVHDLFAPIEPYQDADTGEFRYGWYTYLPTVMGPGGGSFAKTLADRQDIGEVNVASTSGVGIRYLDKNGVEAFKYPVDSDGDGVTDTYQFPVSELGFSKAQVAELSNTLNTSSNSGGDVFLGMRVIAHGGMVNLNESHPNLIINALGLHDVVSNYELTRGPIPGQLEFNHRPSTSGVKYSPQLEEPVLRRRVLLPPRIIAPSLLHGNGLLNPEASGQEFGAADMPSRLFPTDLSGDPVETVYEGAHRYVPFDGLSEAYDLDTPAPTPLWLARMEPFASFDVDDSRNAYDRRHLVTTVSHDDLLSRGGRIVTKLDDDGEPIADMDLREKMIEVNQSVHSSTACPILPFEYANYPHDLPNSGCDCPTDPNCNLNLRKGRLVLSLAWLDKALSDGVITVDKRQRLLHDAFMMLLRNARGAYWDEVACPNGPTDCDPVGGFCDMPDPNDPATWQCYDPVTGLSHRESSISRTAASLTANMIDFMDIDDIDDDGFDDGVPTRVALRSFDFSPPPPNGNPKPNTVGRELGPPTNPGMPRQYVFGLEQQPYITEVTTAAGGTPNNVVVDAWAVELYNPYPDDLIYKPGLDEYLLMQVDPDGDVVEIPLQRTIVGGPNGMFTVFRTDPSGILPVTPILDRVRVYDAVADMDFTDQSILYLVRRVQLVGESDRTDIVVDQFALDGSGTDVARAGDLSTVIPPGTMPPFVFSRGRFIPDQTVSDRKSRWMATVPDTAESAFAHRLGNWSTRTGPEPTPVEVNFANTGSLTGFDPALGVAFPTTGSMLLLMRHANRPFSDRSIETTLRGNGGMSGARRTETVTELAFTTRLDQTMDVADGFGAIVTVREREQIDNGRMPVFDPPVRECLNGTRCRNSDDCSGAPCEQIVPGVHHADPSAAPVNVPGGTEYLPWGQLLWDYFTVLPLSSQGPYPPWDDLGPPYLPAAAESIPRVDLGGLRVHGRININAAPWMVMAGLPLIPMERVPVLFRNKIRDSLGLDPADDLLAVRLAEDVALAAVAYRDAREIEFSVGAGMATTENYGEDVGGGGWRGWGHDAPRARRGTGFLTVGELANVRHADAVDALRIDSGEVDASEPDYVKAVALLASLGDWVTVRSHVFTTYGTLRGEGDDTIADEVERARDVDTRAIRFQETVDRLPNLFGATRPSRIGQRYVGPYVDVRND